MSITSGKVTVLTGLAALALVACGGKDTTWEEYATSTGASSGAGGQGGEMYVPDVEVDWGPACDSLTPDHKIDGFVGDKPSFDESYQPSDLTMKVSEVLRFQPGNSVQNMSSGVNEVEDGKFYTPQGRRSCLVFHVPGTYPFFSYGAPNPMNGTLSVLP